MQNDTDNRVAVGYTGRSGFSVRTGMWGSPSGLPHSVYGRIDSSEPGFSQLSAFMSIETLELFTIGLLLVTLSRVLRARVAAFAGIQPRTPPVPLDPDAG